jgi:hypothetical protein
MEVEATVKCETCGKALPAVGDGYLQCEARQCTVVECLACHEESYAQLHTCSGDEACKSIFCTEHSSKCKEDCPIWSCERCRVRGRCVSCGEKRLEEREANVRHQWAEDDEGDEEDLEEGTGPYVRDIR